MSQSNIQIPSASKSARNWFFVGASLIGLAVWTNTEDPFNAPKAWVLYITSFWLLGWIAFNVKRAIAIPTLRIAVVLSSIFVVTLLGGLFASDNFFISFFGDYARRTGFLAYTSLMIFFLAGCMLINEKNIKTMDLVTLIPGYIIAGYGFFQHFKIDVVKWNNPYNSVLSTLGNPDFAAAVISIFAVLAFAMMINPAKQPLVRLLSAGLVILGFITIIFSQVRQGLLTGITGIGIIIIVWVYQRQKVIAYVMTAGGFLVGFASVLGMLNMGPLVGFFYKLSVSYRGDYWRAGFRMFKEHPFFGVGLDRYGAYFTQYRDATQATRFGRGPGIHSNAAHDVPIQLASTGGIFVLIAFLALIAFIIWRAIVGLRKKSGVDQILFAGFVAAWVAYEAQSLISIDNLGIAIWGWVLGGIIVALSLTESPISTAGITEKKSKAGSAKAPRGRTAVISSTSPAQPVVSYGLATLALIISLPLFLQDGALKTSRSYRVPTSGTEVTAYQSIARKALRFPLKDPHVTVSVATELAQSNALAEGTAMAEKVHAADPRFSEATLLLLNIYEQTHKYQDAIRLRRGLLQLDPFDYTNMLKLGQDLKAVGDIAGAKALLPRIDALAKDSAEAKQAHTEFGA